ncbi:MAG: hypothetical protein AABO57_24350 [Acidobacteriota bacterium]
MEFTTLKKDYSGQTNVLVRNIKRLTPISLKFDYPSRVKVGVLVLAFFSLLSSWELFTANRKEFDLKSSLQGRDGVTLYEQRFVGVKATLSTQGVVGYVSDAQPDGAEFYLTQYTLSPLIVDPTQPHQFVIGNFANRTVDVNKLTTMRLTQRGDFGNGIKLFTVDSK